MTLTWRDGMSTIAIIAIVFAYASYMDGSTVWLLASAWATTAVILMLGSVCVWAIWAAGDLRASSRVTEICRAAEVSIGVICYLAGLAALVRDSVFALRLVVVTVVGMSGLATLRHALTLPPGR